MKVTINYNEEDNITIVGAKSDGDIYREEISDLKTQIVRLLFRVASFIQADETRVEQTTKAIEAYSEMLKGNAPGSDALEPEDIVTYEYRQFLNNIGSLVGMRLQGCKLRTVAIGSHLEIIVSFGKLNRVETIPIGGAITRGQIDTLVDRLAKPFVDRGDLIETNTKTQPSFYQPRCGWKPDKQCCLPDGHKGGHDVDRDNSKAPLDDVF